MGILRTNTLSGIGTDGPVFDGVTKFDTQGYVVPPVGITSDRTLVGVTTAQGAIRFNTDSQKLEFYAQDQWWEMVIDTPALAVSSNTGAGARGVFGGGYTAPGNSNVIQYINISSTGNAIDFGDLTVPRRGVAGCSSNTRGIFGGGTPVLSNTVDYVSISTIGNALDFGDLTIARRTQNGAASSPTRGVFLGGTVPGAYTSIIDFITIASKGNAVNFGNSLFTGAYRTGCSNATRGLFGSGYAPSLINTIEYITISSTGNSVYFGDLTVLRHGTGACASQTRGLWAGGQDATTTFNVIDYVNISSTGNAQDFGDLTVGRNYSGGCSDSHGGLGGF